ncbi:hypothetical protein [Polluticoccus soli]|uniref:hypothetical protein n=1 Tax=Polluticoccus soli TaxID=3034150 RepID=UPI0023E301C8|nr:hypothetical protein [Flavipsychrobacter sp. JY13-12]
MFRNLYRLGMLMYLPLLVLAAVFYLERTAFIDVAFIFFKVLWTGDMAIQGHRFGSAITQVVPWAGGKLGIGLKALMMAYSVWAVLYHFVCYLLCGSVLKNYKMALVLLCSAILFVADSFYWIQSELPQGLPFMAVVLAWMSSERFRGRNALHYALLLACLVTIAFFHPLMFIPTIYLVVFLWLSDEGISKADIAVIAGGVLAAFLAKVFLFPTNYDSSALDHAGGSLGQFTEVFGFETTRLFFKSWLTKYYWIPLLSVGIGVHYLLAKQYAKLLLFVAAMVGYIVLVHTAFRQNVRPFYMENLYLPMGFFIAAALVYDVLPPMRPKLVYGLLAIIALTGIVRIYTTHEKYTARLHWAERFLDRHREGKWVYDDSRVPMDTLMMNWGTPYEFWMLSTIKYDTTASIVIAGDAEAYITPAFNRMDFLTSFEPAPYPELPGRYFKLRDTMSHYAIVGTVGE